MTQEEITTKIEELNKKRMQAWKNMNFNYEIQLKDLVIKLKSDLAHFKSLDEL